MASVKEKIIRDVQAIDDEALLNDVYRLVNQLRNVHEVIKLTDAQKGAVEEARADYRAGIVHDNDRMFRELNGE